MDAIFIRFCAMDRREMMTGVLAAVAALPFKADVSTIEPEPLPLMIVITIDAEGGDVETPEDVFSELHGLDELISERTGEHVPIVIVPKGMTVEAIIDARVT